MFRGVNVAYVVKPFLPSQSDVNFESAFSQTDINILKDAGFNLVRLNLVWPAIFPVLAFKDMDYLEHIKKIIALLAQNNMYVLLTVNMKGLTDLACGFGSPHYAILNHSKLNTSEFPSPLDLNL